MQAEPEENPPAIPDSPEISMQEAYSAYKPWICIVISLLCVILCLGYNFDPSIDSWEKIRRWGAPGSYDILNGELWGLLTSNFLHIELWHIGANLYWLTVLGKKLEFETKRSFFILLIISAGCISSIYQLTLSGITGLGLSGIVYAFFGFIIVKSKSDISYRNFLGRGLVSLFLLWLFFCVYLSYKNILQIGNAAHFSGLLWGMLLAFASTKRKSLVSIKIPVFLFILSFSTLYWVDLSVGYLSQKAYKLHAHGNLREASSIYRSILSKDPQNEWAKENLKGIEIDSIRQVADTTKNLQEASRLFRRIIQMNPAKEILEWANHSLEAIKSDSLSRAAYEETTGQKY